MSFSRRSIAVAWRLRALGIAAPTGSVATAEASSVAAAFSVAEASFPRRAAGSAGTSWIEPLQARNFSIFPGRSREQDEEPAHPSSDGTPTAALSGDLAPTGASADVGLAYTPDAIVDVAALAETAALEAAIEGAWAPTRALDWLLSSVHSYSGLPWWQSIMLTTVGIRLATFPIILMQIKNTYRLSLAKPEVERLLEHMKEEQARGNANATAEYQQRVVKVWEKHGANPVKSMATLLIQAPLFIGFFSALRGLAAAKVPSFAEGGALWFTDLTVADPTYALPVLASATFLLTVELGAADGMEGQTDKTRRTLKNVMRGVAVVIVPFTLNLPAGVFMYWTASNLFSLFQTMLLKVPKVRSVLGVPDPAMLRAAAAGAGAGPEAGKPVVTFSQKPPPRSKLNK